MDRKKQTIVVGISGGVDSSVAAYLLKQEGHKVVGVFVKTWSPEWLPCTWVDEKRDAMRVCAALDIPFHFLDAEKEYKDGVADYMIAEYRAGRTPNPDVLCNRVIKFGVLWEYAQSLGADAIATGHYARVESRRWKVESGESQKQPSPCYSLLSGVDPSKDQSYFLWMLRKDELAHVRFPIGHLQKDEVRAIAKKVGLFTGEKKDSQGICFLGDVDMREFLSHYIQQKKGDVLNEKGERIGTHDGVWFYTIGERHGFTITSKDHQRTPFYVIEKRIDENVLVVSPSIKTRTHTAAQRVSLREVNWIIPVKNGERFQAQVRYHGKRVPVEINSANAITLYSDEAVPLGQSMVIFNGETIIGGGVIDKID